MFEVAGPGEQLLGTVGEHEEAISLDGQVGLLAGGLQAALVCTVSMEPSLTPEPICTGLVPPRPPCAAPAPRRVWLSVSSKVTRLALKPVVLTLAMLLPITS